MKKILVMMAAMLLGVATIGLGIVHQVQAAQCYFYDYNDMIPYTYTENGVTKTEYRPRAYTMEQMNQNLQLLDNINRISEAQLAANTALDLVNATKSQIANLQTALAAKKQEAVANPAFQPQVDELTVQLNSLTNQLNAQTADYQAKQATYETLVATLPTAGYNPNMCNALYGQPKNR